MNISFFSTLGKVDNLNRSAFISWVGSGIKKITYLGEEGKILEHYSADDIDLKFTKRYAEGRPTLIELTSAICDVDADYIIQSNADIVVTPDFKQQLESVLTKYPNNPVAVRRIDVQLKPDVYTVDGVPKWIKEAREQGYRVHKLGTDIHIASKKIWEKMKVSAPALIVGAFCWDLWIQNWFHKVGKPAVDATSKVEIYHPRHAVTLHTDPDAIKNFALVGHPPIGKQCSYGKAWGKIL